MSPDSKMPDPSEQDNPQESDQQSLSEPRPRTGSPADSLLLCPNCNERIYHAPGVHHDRPVCPQCHTPVTAGRAEQTPAEQPAESPADDVLDLLPADDSPDDSAGLLTLEPVPADEPASGLPDGEEVPVLATTASGATEAEPPASAAEPSELALASLRCPGCTAENAADARSCSSCGRELYESCPTCEAAVFVGADTCGECGADLAGERRARALERRAKEALDRGSQADRDPEERAGSLEEASSALRELLESSPDREGAKEQVAAVESEQVALFEQMSKSAEVDGRHGAALQLYGKLLELRPDHAEAAARQQALTEIRQGVLQQAAEAQSAGDLSRAVSLLQDALENFAEDEEIQGALQEAVTAEEQRAAGLGRVSALRDAKSYHALRRLCQELRSMKVDEEDVTGLEAAADEAVQGADAVCAKAEELWQGGEHEKAIQKFQDALALVSDHPLAGQRVLETTEFLKEADDGLRRAKKWLEQRHYKEARRAAEAVLRQIPDTPEAEEIIESAEVELRRARKHTRMILSSAACFLVVCVGLWQGWGWLNTYWEKQDYEACLAASEVETEYEKALSLGTRYLEKWGEEARYEKEIKKLKKEVLVKIDDRDFRRFKAAAAKAAEKHDYQKAVALIEGYLKKHRKARHADEANEEIELLEDHRDFHEAALAANEAAGKKDFASAIKAYEDYGRKRPNGQHVEDANTKIVGFRDDWDFYKAEQAAAEAVAKEDLKTAIAAYEQYKKKQSLGRHVPKADEAIALLVDDLHFQEAQEEADEAEGDLQAIIAAYQGYLDAHPNGRHVDEARRAIADPADQLDFQKAGELAQAAEKRLDFQAAIDAYEKYLKGHPKGKHADEATARRDALTDDLHFHKARLAAEAAVEEEDYAAAIKEYEGYKKVEHKPKNHVKEADEQVALLTDDLHFQQAKAKAEEAKDDPKAIIAAYQWYLDLHDPDGRHVDEARAAIRDPADELDFRKAELAAKEAEQKPDFDAAIQAYETYKKEHENGKFVAKADERISALRDERDFRLAGAAAKTAEKEQDWQTAIRVYEVHRRAHDQCKHLNEVSERLEALQDELDFQTAEATEKKAGDRYEVAIAAYTAYLKKHDDGEHADEANERVTQLRDKIDERDWATCQASAKQAGENYEDAVLAYQVYLGQHPEGKYAKLAKEMIEVELPDKIDDRDFRIAEKGFLSAGDDREKAWQSYHKYLLEHGKGKHAGKVQQKMAAAFAAAIASARSCMAKRDCAGVASALTEAVAIYRDREHRDIQSLFAEAVKLLDRLGRADLASAAKLYQVLADFGHAESQYRLGVLCDDGGAGFAKDHKQAFTCFDKAAKQGHLLAQYRLGKCYAEAKGVTRDYGKAVECFRAAAERGCLEAQYELAHCYAAGRGVAREPGAAVEWLSKAANQGSAPAQYELGVGHYDGGEHDEAVKWFRKAAEQGHTLAQYRLGECYAEGKGTERSPAGAFEWFQRAARQNHAPAQYETGMCYLLGKGTAKNSLLALEWLRKAAKQGHAPAQYVLGQCSERGIGVLKNLSKAAEWYSKAAKQDLADAQSALGRCYIYGLGVTKDYAKAKEWLEQAAARKHPDALYHLGRLYYEGWGVARNPSTAANYWKAAAKGGDSGAIGELKRLGLSWD